MHRKSLEAAEHIRKQDEIDFGDNSDSNSNTNNNTMTSSTSSSANSSPNETHKSSIDGNKPESLMSPESNHESAMTKMPNFLNLINNLNDLDSKTTTANTAKSHGHKKAAIANGEPSANIDFKTKSVANLRAKAKEHCKLLNDIFNGSSKIKKPPSQNDHHQSKFKIEEKNSARINCDEIID